LSNSGAGLVVLCEAGKRSAPWWNTSFSNEAQGKQNKRECSSNFGTVPSLQSTGKGFLPVRKPFFSVFQYTFSEE
jgi:hypothetical protein